MAVSYIYIFDEDDVIKVEPVSTSLMSNELIQNNTSQPRESSQPKESDLQAVNFSDRSLDSINMIFASVNSIDAQMNIIEKLIDEGKDGLALDLLSQLHNRCSNVKEAEMNPPHDLTAWAFEKTIDSCRGYDPNLYNYLSDSEISNSIYKPNFMSLLDAGGDIDYLSDQHLAMLSQIESRKSLDIADIVFGALLRNKGVSLELGQDATTNILELDRIHGYALDIYACQRFGGCGPDDFITLNACAFTPQCQRGWSLMDIYQSSISPNSFDQMMNIVYTIMNYDNSG